MHSVGFSAEPPQGFQQGQIGFPRAILFDALPVAGPYHLLGCHPRHKGVDECGLADAGLPGDQPDLALSLLGQDPPLVELSQLRL
jgi:hypothetical protein